MLNASVGFQRVLGRVRRPQNDRPASDAPREVRRSAVAPKVRHGIRSVVVASRLAPIREHRAAAVVETPVVVASVAAPAEHRRSLIARLGPDRAVAVAVAAILVGASVISVSAGDPGGATGGTNGAGPAPRIAVGGGTTRRYRRHRRTDGTIESAPSRGRRLGHRPIRPAASSSASRPR